MTKIIVLSILMMLVTAPSRILPAFFLTGKKLPPFVESFLYYVPFTILGSLIFPDILNSTGDFYSSIVGATTAFLLAWFDGGPLVILLGAIISSFIVSHIGIF